MQNYQDTATAEQVRRALDYDKTTGLLRWRIRDDVPKGWNTRHAGKTAGSICEFNGGKFYVSVRLDGVAYLAHRLIWLHVTGEWPVNEVDHQDGDGLHNWWDNLREGTRVQNSFNRTAQKNSQSGIKGISRHGNRWRARITANGLTAIETFVVLEDAKAWHAKMERMLHGEFAPQRQSS